MKRNKTGERGFTLMEIVVVLAVIGLLAAILTPMVLTYLEDAKRSKAEGDAQQIGAAIAKLTKDVDHFPAYTNGTQTAGAATIDLLCGPGNIPTLATGVTGWPGVPTTSAPCAANPTAKVDEIANHVVKNQPGGGTTPYATGARGRVWRGPYLEKVNEDPYGNSYVVNIKNAPADSAVAAKVVWALSAGPDGKIDTNGDFNADAGPAVGGDDIAIRLK
jgi:general secretion pathway protein G